MNKPEVSYEEKRNLQWEAIREAPDGTVLPAENVRELEQLAINFGRVQREEEILGIIKDLLMGQNGLSGERVGGYVKALHELRERISQVKEVGK